MLRQGRMVEILQAYGVIEESLPQHQPSFERAPHYPRAPCRFDESYPGSFYP